MNGQILKQTEFPAVGSDAFLKQTKLNLFPLVLTCLVLFGANNVWAADLYVPADYATIQAAIDAAASGDTIHIAPGVYVEQTRIIGKDLTLIGRPGAILRAYAGMERSLAALGSESAALLGIAQSDVVVSGLTFEGEQLGDGLPGDFRGIYFLGASGRVEDCRITGFRRRALGEPGKFPSFGVLGFNSVSLGTGVVEIMVLRSTFADNERSIGFTGDVPNNFQPTFDPTLLRTTFTINDNTIVGNGPDVTGLQYGIEIQAGASGEVKRNIITDHAYAGTTDPVPFSYGVKAGNGGDALQPLHIEDNIFRNNQLHCVLLRVDAGVVVNNTFEGTAPGGRPTGLLFSGEDVLVATNRFSDMETGVLLLGDDPDFGTSIGIASNATLVDNGFCNVVMNYDLQPLATYDLQNTLTCPEPTLDTVQAILLSWPSAYDGYSVESADSPDGPWTALDATLFQQNGMNYAVVPSDGAAEFFRLVKP